MAKHVIEYTLNTDPQRVFDFVDQYLTSEGYRYREYQGENVFQKGRGWLCAPSFFKFTFIDNKMILETWMKYALLPGVYVGEIGLTGPVGAFVKGPWKRRLKEIIMTLQQFVVDDSDPSGGAGVPDGPPIRSGVDEPPVTTAVDPINSYSSITCESGMYKGASFQIYNGEQLLIGTDPSACNIIINEDSSIISRKHCQVEFNAAQNCYIVTDFSRNGTFLESGERLMKGNPERVEIGMLILLGDAKNSFRLG